MNTNEMALAHAMSNQYDRRLWDLARQVYAEQQMKKAPPNSKPAVMELRLTDHQVRVYTKQVNDAMVSIERWCAAEKDIRLNSSYDEITTEQVYTYSGPKYKIDALANFADNVNIQMRRAMLAADAASSFIDPGSVIWPSSADFDKATKRSSLSVLSRGLSFNGHSLKALS